VTACVRHEDTHIGPSIHGPLPLMTPYPNSHPRAEPLVSSSPRFESRLGPLHRFPQVPILRVLGLQLVVRVRGLRPEVGGPRDVLRGQAPCPPPSTDNPTPPLPHGAPTLLPERWAWYKHRTFPCVALYPLTSETGVVQARMTLVAIQGLRLCHT
jgi:hypothetical protein